MSASPKRPLTRINRLKAFNSVYSSDSFLEAAHCMTCSISADRSAIVTLLIGYNKLDLAGMTGHWDIDL